MKRIAVMSHFFYKLFCETPPLDKSDRIGRCRKFPKATRVFKVTKEEKREQVRKWLTNKQLGWMVKKNVKLEHNSTLVSFNQDWDQSLNLAFAKCLSLQP